MRMSCCSPSRCPTSPTCRRGSASRSTDLGKGCAASCCVTASWSGPTCRAISAADGRPGRPDAHVLLRRPQQHRRRRSAAPAALATRTVPDAGALRHERRRFLRPARQPRGRAGQPHRDLKQVCDKPRLVSCRTRGGQYEPPAVSTIDRSLPPASPGSGASRRPALPSATANALSRMAATREAVGAIMTSSDASNGPSKSACARPHKATSVASSRLTRAQAGQMNLHRPPRAEQKRIHGDGEVGQRVEQARHLETAMQGRAFRRQSAILLPLAQGPQHEALADRQAAGTPGRPQPGFGSVEERPGPFRFAELSMTSSLFDIVVSHMQVRSIRN